MQFPRHFLIMTNYAVKIFYALFDFKVPKMLHLTQCAFFCYYFRQSGHLPSGTYFAGPHEILISNTCPKVRNRKFNFNANKSSCAVFYALYGAQGWIFLFHFQAVEIYKRSCIEYLTVLCLVNYVTVFICVCTAHKLVTFSQFWRKLKFRSAVSLTKLGILQRLANFSKRQW